MSNVVAIMRGVRDELRRSIANRAKEDTPVSNFELRLNICKECPLMKPTIVGMLCTSCKCVLNAKAAVPSEHCPIGKW